MAVISGLFSRAKGSVGNVTFRRASGRTIASERTLTTTNVRTAGQQRQRMKFTNVVHMYKGIAPLINYGFENKAPGQSDYNLFVKCNIRRKPVYLTKALADQQACVAAPYQLSLGSLSAISVKEEDKHYVSSINLGDLVIDKTTTVSEFSTAVVLHNYPFTYGDQISFFIITQKKNPFTGVPYCVFEAKSVVLKRFANTLLWDETGTDGFTAHDGLLAFDATDFQGCFCWVHSRKTAKGTTVSSQWLIDANPLLEEYTSESAYYAAVATYGGESSSFLTPDTADTADTASADTGSGNTPSAGGGSSSAGSDNTGGESKPGSESKDDTPSSGGGSKDDTPSSGGGTKDDTPSSGDGSDD